MAVLTEATEVSTIEDTETNGFTGPMTWAEPEIYTITPPPTVTETFGG